MTNVAIKKKTSGSVTKPISKWRAVVGLEPSTQIHQLSNVCKWHSVTPETISRSRDMKLYVIGFGSVFDAFADPEIFSAAASNGICKNFSRKSYFHMTGNYIKDVMEGSLTTDD